MKKCKIHKPASNYFKSTVTTTTLFIHITHNISWMSTLTPQEVVLNQRDILRIVRCLKVVVKVVDASSNETDGKATIVGMLLLVLYHCNNFMNFLIISNGYF